MHAYHRDGSKPETSSGKIEANFFNRPADELAPLLLGMQLVRFAAGKETRYTITDVQAYTGDGDADSHPYRGPSSSGVTWQPGALYIYSVQGHTILTFATPPYSDGACVLVRGISDGKTKIEGPGKVSKALLVTTDDNGTNVLGGSLRLEVGQSVNPQDIVVSERLNSKNPELQLRFRLK